MGRIQSCLALYLIREPGTWWLSLPSAGCWKTRPGLAPPTPLVMDHSKSQVSFRATHRHQTFGKQPWRPVGRHGALGGSHGHDPCRPQPLSATQARKNSGGNCGWQGASRPLGSYRRLQLLCLRSWPRWLLASGQGCRHAMQLQLQPHATVQSA